ncbi:MAG TPA: transcriptional regulator [Gammaproteobacteria bacterium]|nr:transcriptional regulator [Gammaproteobacteria bacterium]
MKPADFFNQHPVFTSKEYAGFLELEKHAGERAQEALLSYHIKAGNLIRVRRGLFAVVPSGSSPESYAVDPYLIAAKLVDNTVIGYHSALAFYGKSYSITHQFCVLSHARSANIPFREDIFRLVLFPKSLREKRQEMFGVKTVLHRGCQLRVTGFERTLVDMLDRPDLSGGWEEVWRSLESVEYFDLDKVIEYAFLLDNVTTIALVGFYLEQHQKELRVKDYHLAKLEARRPKQPHYVDKLQKSSSKFNSRWNLIIPSEIIEQSWKEES